MFRKAALVSKYPTPNMCSMHTETHNNVWNCDRNVIGWDNKRTIRHPGGEEEEEVTSHPGGKEGRILDTQIVRMGGY